ncbi:MAG: PAS domain-containing protein [Alphaproteobacteria bacterium]|nr:PAS domain-containing protein [Alphaproteobacteria bacterium]
MEGARRVAEGRAFGRSRRVLFALAVTACAVFVGATAWSIRQSHRQSIMAAEHEAVNLARVLDQHAEGVFAQVDHLLRHVAREHRSGHEPSDMNEDVVELPRMRSLMILDEAGRLDTIYGGFEAGFDSRGAALLAGGGEGEGLSIGGPFRGGNDDWMIPVWRPLFDREGTRAGWVVAILESTQFATFYKSLNLGQGGLVSVVHADGPLLFRAPSIEAMIGQDLSGRPLFVEHLARAPSGVFRIVTGGDAVDRIQAYRRVSGLPLVVMVGLSVDHVLADWRRNALYQGAFALGMVGLVAALALALARQLRHLRDSEQGLKAIADYTYDWEHWVAPDGRLLWVSPAVQRLTGYLPAECLAMEDFPLPLIHPDERATVGARWREAPQGGSARDLEFRLLRKDGGVIRASVSWQPIRDGAGPLGVRSSVRDITKRRLIEDALLESRARLTRAQQIAKLGSWELDIDSGRLWWSDEVHRIFGVDQQVAEPTYQTLLDHVHEDDRLAVIQAMDATLNEGRPFSIDHRVNLPRGEERFVHEQAEVILDADGRPSRMIGTLQDITERKHMQSQLVQSAKLATLGEMAAGMAHELSQPLNIMRMAADGMLLMLERGKASAERQKGQFELIAEQARRMGEIIDHIRIFSRADSGPVGVFDALGAVNMAVSLLRPQLQAEGIHIELDPSSQRCLVRGRPVQLEQVMVNLLTNAKDALRERLARRPHPPGLIRVGAGCTGETVLITVADNGTGIPANLIDRLFEPFFTTKEVGSGTGLGLSVSFGIVSSMDGQIKARNGREGAVFEVALPGARPCRLTERAGPLRVPTPPPAVSSGDGRHVLVVDDEGQAAVAMADYLNGLGYRTTMARDGMSALECFAADPADVVVTDLRMPGGDGHALIEAIRNRNPRQPILVVTGHLGVTEHDAAPRADQHLLVMRKPISLKTLGDNVDTLSRAAVPTPSCPDLIRAST